MEDMHNREARAEINVGKKTERSFFLVVYKRSLFTVKEYEILQLHFVTLVMFAILYASVP